MVELDKLECAHFVACLDQDFIITTQAGQISLKLTEARPLGSSHSGAVRTPFSLTFQGAPNLLLPQGIYPISNSQFGPMDLFLVQTGADPKGSYFQAIFT